MTGGAGNFSCPARLAVLVVHRQRYIRGFAEALPYTAGPQRHLARVRGRGWLLGRGHADIAMAAETQLFDLVFSLAQCLRPDARGVGSIVRYMALSAGSRLLHVLAQHVGAVAGGNTKVVVGIVHAAFFLMAHKTQLAVFDNRFS